MSSKTIIIESNRNIAYEEEYKNITIQDENLDPNKKIPNFRWKTHIGEGVTINTGDQIQLEAAMINAVGGGEGVMEFLGNSALGQTDSLGLVDNQATIGLQYYLADRKQFNMPFPKMGSVVNRADHRAVDFGELDFTTYHNFLKNYYTQGLEGWYADGDPSSWKEIDKFTANHTKSRPNSASIQPSSTRLFIMSRDFEGYFVPGTDRLENNRLFATEFEIKVPEGFNTPGALGEIITAQFHARLGAADSWENTPAVPQTFFIDSGSHLNGFAQPQVSDNCMRCFPTLTGRLCYGNQAADGDTSNGMGVYQACGKLPGMVNEGDRYTEAGGKACYYSFMMTGIPENIPYFQVHANICSNFCSSPVNNTKKLDGVFTGPNPDGNGVGEMGRGGILLFDDLDYDTSENINCIFKNVNPTTFDGNTKVVNSVANMKILTTKENELIVLNLAFTASNVAQLGFLLRQTEQPIGANSTSVTIDPSNPTYLRALESELYYGRSSDSDCLPATRLAVNQTNPRAVSLVLAGKQAAIPNSYPPQNVANIQGGANHQYTLGVPQNLPFGGVGNRLRFRSRQVNNDLLPSSSNFNCTLPTNSWFEIRTDIGRVDLFEESINIDYAAVQNFAVVPVFPKAGTAFATEFGLDPNIPFCAIVSTRPIPKTATYPYPMVGEYFGRSPQVTDNNFHGIINTQKTDSAPSGTSKTIQYLQGNVNPSIVSQIYMPYVMLGADNPTLNFDGDVSRFALSELHCQVRAGNKIFPWFQNDQGPKNSTQAATEVITTFEIEGAIGFNSENDQGKFHPFIENQMNPQIGGNDFMTSQGGIAIFNLTTKNRAGTDIFLTPYKPDLFNGTLFSKLGFSIEQLLPFYGRPQNEFNRGNISSSLGLNVPINQKYQNMVLPLTTNSYISGAVNLPMTKSFAEGGTALEVIGGGVARITQTNTNAESDELQAINLPSKLDYPYLVVYSDIIRNPDYYGGNTGFTKLPAIAYITRNYATGDYFYSFATNWTYTADHDYTITDITTDIRLPNGQPAPINENSSVIYKITKVQAMPPPPPLEENKISHSSKKDGKEK